MSTPPTPADLADPVDDEAAAAFRRAYGDLPAGEVAVVIAAYDEAAGIGGVVRGVPATTSGGLSTTTIVVDDGSRDETAARAREAGARVCTPSRNRGQGAALRLGYRLARESGARYVVTTDADGQYDIDELPALLAPLLDDRADFVTGSRVLGRAETTDRVRGAGTVFFARLVSLLTGTRITDTSFGFRAMRAEVTAAVRLEQPQYQSSELLIGVLAAGYRVVEVPATMRVRGQGRSKKGGNLVYGSRYARVVLGTWWRERGRARARR